MKTISDSYIAISAIKDIQEIAKPLTEILGIERFCYHKIFPNGQEICFSNDLNWVQFVYQNNVTMGSKLNSLENPSFETLLWPFEDTLAGYKAVREIWNCHYGIDLANDHNEYFGFSSHQKDTRSINKYLNNINELKRFAQYFNEKAQPIIQAASQNMLLHFEKVSLKKIHLYQELDIKNKFLTATPITSYRTHTGYTKELKFTPREIDCLRLFIRGYTTHEVATSLAISTRTAETHLENIKNKAGVANKSELIRFIFSNKIDKFF